MYEYSESQQELQLDPPSLTVPPYELLHDGMVLCMMWYLAIGVYNSDSLGDD